MVENVMTFWDSDPWREYEHLCGEEPGTRSRLLASADWQTRVCDLALSEAELWQGVRKSYHSLIHAVERQHPIREGRTAVDIGIAAAFHQAEAGRQTRPIETWELMAEWIESGHGLLMMTSGAFVYCTVYQAWSYYHSSAALEKNLTHALLWHAMKALKARGVRWLELGWQARECDSDKDRGISMLKRGLGGYDMPAKEAPELCDK